MLGHILGNPFFLGGMSSLQKANWTNTFTFFWKIFIPEWWSCESFLASFLPGGVAVHVTFSSQFPQHYCHFLVLVHVLQDLVHHHSGIGSSAPASFSCLRLTPIHVESNSLNSWCKLVCWLQQALQLLWSADNTSLGQSLTRACWHCPAQSSPAHQAADCHGCLRLGAGSEQASLYQVSSTRAVVLYN
jgi:hypothetical protein